MSQPTLDINGVLWAIVINGAAQLPAFFMKTWLLWVIIAGLLILVKLVDVVAGGIRIGRRRRY